MSKEMLLQIIDKSGLTKQQFAKSINLHAYTVDKWLAGLFKPSARSQAKIRETHKKSIAKLYK